MIGKALRTPKAILLDMDDTILASRQTSKECWANLCDKYAPQIDGLTPQKLLAAIYENIYWFWTDPERNNWGRIHPIQANRKLIARTFQQLGIETTELVNEIADGFHVARIKTIQPFPGAIDALRHFRDMGIRLALITNGSTKIQRLKIDKFKLDRFFDHVLVEDEFGAGKPEKEVYLHTLNELGVTPQEAWMVGDNLACDVAGPQRVGIFAIWNDFERSGLPDNAITRPDKIIHSLSELEGFLDLQI
jgi:putative hydrolase of the HAD superfamily